MSVVYGSSGELVAFASDFLEDHEIPWLGPEIFYLTFGNLLLQSAYVWATNLPYYISLAGVQSDLFLRAPRGSVAHPAS